MHRAILETPLHPCVIAVSDHGLCSLSLISADDLKQNQRICRLQPAPSQMQRIHIKATEGWLEAYFSGQDQKSPDLDISAGTEFQQKVWRALHSTLKGETITYGELAKQAGHPNASRAVGSAMATNPICLIIPCHRVVQSDGGLGNYSGHGGPVTKRYLLDFEASD